MESDRAIFIESDVLSRRKFLSGCYRGNRNVDRIALFVPFDDLPRSFWFPCV